MRCLVASGSSTLIDRVEEQVARVLPGVELLPPARTGSEVVRRTGLEAPDLLFLDLELPRMDGLTTLRALAAPRPRTIVLTPDTLDGGRAAWDALRMGARDLLSKRAIQHADRDPEADASVAAVLRGSLTPFLPPAARRVLLRSRPSAPAELADSGLLFLSLGTGRLVRAARCLRRQAAGILAPILVDLGSSSRLTRGLCEGLDRMIDLPVRIAVRDERPVPRQILVIPGGYRARIDRGDGPVRLGLEREPVHGAAGPQRRRTLRDLLDPSRTGVAVAIDTPADLVDLESIAREAIDRRRLFHLVAGSPTGPNLPHLRTVTALRIRSSRIPA
ncbi:MAG: response regulator [Candidatus Eisenbacteria bacterium]|nr:response regulator [Candidatus Latescibacterota bacterium]MBD3302969.1 response regulator [Candidatus Eisenbacteria bacterium]